MKTPTIVQLLISIPRAKALEELTEVSSKRKVLLDVFDDVNTNNVTLRNVTPTCTCDTRTTLERMLQYTILRT